MTSQEILEEIKTLKPTLGAATEIELHIVGSCYLQHYEKIRERAKNLGYRLIAASEFVCDCTTCAVLQFAKRMPYDDIIQNKRERIREIFNDKQNEAYGISITPGANDISIPFDGDFYYTLFPVKSLAEAFPTKI